MHLELMRFLRLGWLKCFVTLDDLAAAEDFFLSFPKILSKLNIIDSFTDHGGKRCSGVYLK